MAENVVSLTGGLKAGGVPTVTVPSLQNTRRSSVPRPTTMMCRTPSTVGRWAMDGFEENLIASYWAQVPVEPVVAIPQ